MLVVAMVHPGWITVMRCWQVFLPTYIAVFSRYLMRRLDHITDAVISLHWLRVRERIEFKLATLTHKLLHNQAPSYLVSLVRVADVPGRRALRSANTDRLMVPHVRLSSVGNRAFPLDAPCVWNNPPSEVTSAQSPHSFRRHLKTFLFQRSILDVIVTL